MHLKTIKIENLIGENFLKLNYNLASPVFFPTTVTTKLTTRTSEITTAIATTKTTTAIRTIMSSKLLDGL
jgi:hypothetical protein